jgi:hypothetical protein
LRIFTCVAAVVVLGATWNAVSKDVPGIAPVTSRGLVALSTSVGDVRVKAWSSPTVRWIAHEHAASQADLARLQIDITKDAGNLTLTAIPFTGCDRCGIDLSVWVPKSVSVTASSATGDISVIGLANTVIARTSKGDIDIDASDGDVLAQTEVGDVSARLPSVSGAHKIILSTVIGDVGLSLSRGAGASITASTSVGEISSDFGSPQTRITSQTLQTKTGDGGVQIRLSTHTGDVAVRAL